MNVGNIIDALMSIRALNFQIFSKPMQNSPIRAIV